MTHVEDKWIPTYSYWLQQLRSKPLIAVIRGLDRDLTLRQVAIAVESGIEFIEIALSTHHAPESLELIARIRHQYPQAQIGAGTVLTPEQAQGVIQMGAQFVVSPFLDLEIVQQCHHQQIPVIPGALTPKEIWQAWQAGVAAVKVFPIESVGGASYLRHLRKPLGSLPLIPTGGVTLSNTQDFLQAGAIGVGIGSDLFPATLIAVGDWQGIQTRLRTGILEIGDRDLEDAEAQDYR